VGWTGSITFGIQTRRYNCINFTITKQPGCTDTYNCLLTFFPPGDLLILATVCPLALNNVLEEPELLSTHGSWLSIINSTSRKFRHSEKNLDTVQKERIRQAVKSVLTLM